MALQIKQATNAVKDESIQVAENIKISAKQHEELVEYLKARLDFAKEDRDQRAERYAAIDKEVSGFMELDEDDKKRQLDNQKGRGPKVYDINIPLAASQMDEAVTYFTTVFFPEEGPYNAVTSSDKQAVAKGFSTLMNQHSTFYSHFTHFAKGAYAGLKYNLGLWTVEWEETKGSIIQNSAGGIAAEVLEGQTVMTGNKLNVEDAYNTLLDPSVHPVELHASGEFFAVVEEKSVFRARLMEQNDEIFNLNNVIDKEGNQTGNYASEYYYEKPEIHGDARPSSTNRKTNWISFLSASMHAKDLAGLEEINMYIWLPAKRFGLLKQGEKEQYQIWRITLLNMVVVKAERLSNAHGFLPLLATVPWDDNFGTEANSYAEMLLPYQRFSSFQINVHQRASRKSLYNLIIYNSRLVPQLANADVLGGLVPFSTTGDENDIRKSVLQISDVPDTTNTLRDIEQMDGLMQKILPTDMLKQVASLERATQYQAAATVQGANRRNLKIAKIIDTQAFSVGRKIQMYNILQFQEAIEILDPAGNLVPINPAELREQKMEFTISDGLRGLDKLILVETMKDIIALLVQNPQAAAQFNIADIINYATTLIGDHTSFKQFAYKNEFDKLTPQQKEVAFQLLQRALQQQGAREGANAAPQNEVAE